MTNKIFGFMFVVGISISSITSFYSIEELQFITKTEHKMIVKIIFFMNINFFLDQDIR